MVRVKRPYIQVVFTGLPDLAPLANGLGEFLSPPVTVSGVVERVRRLLLDRNQHLAPSFDGGDDFIGLLGSFGRGAVRVGLGEDSFDGGLKFDEKLENTTLELLPVSLAKKPSTALSQGAEGAVKWNVQRF